MTGPKKLVGAAETPRDLSDAEYLVRVMLQRLGDDAPQERIVRLLVEETPALVTDHLLMLADFLDEDRYEAARHPAPGREVPELDRGVPDGRLWVYGPLPEAVPGTHIEIRYPVGWSGPEDLEEIIPLEPELGLWVYPDGSLDKPGRHYHGTSWRYR